MLCHFIENRDRIRPKHLHALLQRRVEVGSHVDIQLKLIGKQLHHQYEYLAFLTTAATSLTITSLTIRTGTDAVINAQVIS